MGYIISVDDCTTSTTVAAAYQRGSVDTLDLGLPIRLEGKGLRGTTLALGGDRCHGLAKGSKVDRVGEGVSGGDRAVARRRAAGIRVESTHRPTNGFKTTEVSWGR